MTPRPGLVHRDRPSPGPSGRVRAGDARSRRFARRIAAQRALSSLARLGL